MNEEKTDRLIQRADELDNQVDHVVDILQEGFRQHTRILKVLTGVCTLLGLVLIGLTYGALRIQSNSKGLAKVEDLCVSNNANRKQEEALWDFILIIPPREPRTPEQQKIIDDIKALVIETYKPRDCSIP